MYKMQIDRNYLISLFNGQLIEDDRVSAYYKILVTNIGIRH